MKKLKTVIILTAIALPLFVLVMWLNKFGEAEGMLEKLRIIADAFTIPGVLIGGIGAIVWVASKGLFDGVGFSFKYIGHMFLPGGFAQHENFYDYKMRKEEKREKNKVYLPMMAYGGVMIVIAIIIIIVMQVIE